MKRGGDMREDYIRKLDQARGEIASLEAQEKVMSLELNNGNSLGKLFHSPSSYCFRQIKSPPSASTMKSSCATIIKG